MEPQRYLRALRRGWWLVALGLVAGIGAAVAYISTATPTYAAKLSFLVGIATPQGGSPLTSPDSISQFLQAQATTFAQLASSAKLADQIAANTDINLPANAIANEISGAATLNTQLFTVTVTDANPQRAKAIAQAVAVQYPRLVDTLSRTVGSGTPVALTVTNNPKLESGPVSPRKKLDLAAGALAGLVLGLIAAVLRELQDTGVRTPEQVRELTGLPVLAEISRDREARRTPLVIDQRDGRRRAEEYRHLRTNLSFIDAAEPVQVLVVTSAASLEGKTTTSANLGIAAADTDARVLLIEADMRRPTLSAALGLETASGLSNVLAGQVDVEDVLQPWGDHGMMVLASGPTPPNPSDLLAGQRMADLVTKLRQHFDLIIIDTPPVLAVTDAALAARLADGVLIVARHGSTKHNQLAQVVRAITSVDARPLGVVLTMQPRRGVDKSYSATGYYTSPDTDRKRDTAPAPNGTGKARANVPAAGSARPNRKTGSNGKVTAPGASRPGSSKRP